MDDEKQKESKVSAFRRYGWVSRTCNYRTMATRIYSTYLTRVI